MTHKDAHKLLDAAWKSYRKTTAGKSDSISQIAEAVGIPYTNAYNAIHGRTKCSADTWVKLMRYLKGLEIKL